MQSYEAIIEKHARDRARVPDVSRSGPCQEDHLSKYFQNGNQKKFALTNEQFLTSKVYSAESPPHRTCQMSTKKRDSPR